MLDEILNIPGNRAVYGRLRGLLEAGSAYAFVGAGASAPLYPLWGKLIEKLAEEPVRLGLADGAAKQFWLRSANDKPLLVASQIKARLGDSYYYPFLYETFKDRIGSDGQGYTHSQSALIRMNFKAWITTNYDPGLLEARRVLRPEIRETGFSVWKDFKRDQWKNGDVLFAHGHFAAAENIVLDHASFRRAYHDTPYGRFFESLWFEEHLVFAGFSFRDVTLGQIADEVLWQTARQDGSAPRHVAILGLSEAYTAEMRAEMLGSYHSEALFYPVRGGDHSALTVLLDSLARPPVTLAVALPPTAPTTAPSLFAHETTEDAKFTGRVDVLKRLDRWSADPKVRVIAITAIGGLGKTALLGHWLRSAAFPVFFWSFYRERDPHLLFERLLAFGREHLGWTPSRQDASPRAQCLELLAAQRLIVGLDGLEVIQEAPGTVAYAKLLDVNLADFLHAQCGRKSQSLIVLTSRFPFPDLTCYLGRALASLHLRQLTPSEGADLLDNLDVGGDSADREQISRELSGHPLALRIFARSAPGEARMHIGGKGSLEEKMHRLLTFYERQLPEGQKEVLGLISLFRAPIDEPTLQTLWTSLTPQTTSLHAALQQLRQENLLTVDPAANGDLQYACHPILRDHFRARTLGRDGLAGKAASLLAGPPDSLPAQSLAEVQKIAAAIDMLLEAGQFAAANDLFRARLQKGNIVRALALSHIGLEIARSFVRDQNRRRQLEEQLGPMQLAFYLNEAGLSASNAGEPETAVNFYQQARDVYRSEGYQPNISAALQNLGDVEISLGLITAATANCAEALELAGDDEGELRTRLCYLAYCESLHGEKDAADRDFARANAIEKRIDPDGDELHSLRGIHWAEHLLRSQSYQRARTLTEANRGICERFGWLDHAAACHWILGWLDTLEGHFDAAQAHLDQAKTVYSAGHMIHDLARLHVAEALLHFGQRQFDNALAACERALQLAAPRNYRLVHADSLNLRARIALENSPANLSAARDDAEAALQLADICEYAWGQRDARELLARAT